METTADRRKRKLIALAAQKGGLAIVAAECGLSAAALDQVVKGVELPPKKDGSRSKRSLGDAAVLAIESRYQLGTGWFDSDDQHKVFISYGAEDHELVKALGVLLSHIQAAESYDRIAAGALIPELFANSTNSVHIARRIAEILTPSLRHNVSHETPSSAEPQERPDDFIINLSGGENDGSGDRVTEEEERRRAAGDRARGTTGKR